MNTVHLSSFATPEILKEPLNRCRLDSNKLWSLQRNLISGITSRLTDNEDSGDKLDQPSSCASASSSSNSRKSKIRSIYGQPPRVETDSAGTNNMQHSNRKNSSSCRSLESLDRSWDSGQSLGSGSTSVSDLHAVSGSTTPTNAIGAGNVNCASDLGTSVESSDNEADGEIDNTSPLPPPLRCTSSSSGCSSSTNSSSTSSTDEEVDREAKLFMHHFVANIFADSTSISLEAKAKFGFHARNPSGRLWFARFVSRQRSEHQCVSESTLYSLTQYFAIILFECAETDDFTPAKILMNMCFTFYHIVPTTRRGSLDHHQQPEAGSRQYLCSVLRDQPIWRSIRFWNAIFFDAVQSERANHYNHKNNKNSNWEDDAQFQANVTFGQLGTFTHNMHSFGLPKGLCLEFLRKQSTIANLTNEHIQMLRDNIDSMYRPPAGC